MTTDRPHSPTPLSAAYRWLECPGSIPFEQTLTPMPATKHMDEGTKAHARAEGALRWLFSHIGGPPVEWKIAGLEGDEELTGFVRHVVDHYRSQAKKPPRVLLEQRVTLDAGLELFGTCDVAMRTGRKSAVIVDLKWGRGYAVEAADNPQLAGYAAALDATYGPFDSVEVQIYQPRAYHPVMPMRSWVLTREVISDWSWKLREGAKRVRSMPADRPETWERKTGPWCGSCPCAGVCPALKAHVDVAMPEAQVPAVLDAVDATFPGAVMTSVVTPPDVGALTPEQVSRILTVAPMARRFLDAVEKRALLDGINGKPPPGHKVVRSRGRRVWTDGAEAGLQALGVDPYERKLRALTAVEKEVGRKAIEGLVVKRAGGPTLVPLADPRPALAGEVSGCEFPDDLESE